MIKRLICWIMGHRWVEINEDNFSEMLMLEMFVRGRYLNPNAKSICSRCGKIL